MKTSTVGLVSAAILMVVAVVGFGIAQAGGNYTDGPVLSLDDQVALEQSDSFSPHALVLPSAIDVAYGADGIQLASENQEFVPEDNWSGTNWQIRGAMETGSLPDEVNADSSIPETEDISHRTGGEDIDDSSLRNPMEAGSLPAESYVGYSSNISTEEDVYQGSGFIDTGGNE